VVRWPLFHIARAELLSRLGRRDEARAACGAALALGPPRRERALVERRMRELP
jgi:RNA polymerase sigma-70 factor (ECF subfamily)